MPTFPRPTATPSLGEVLSVSIEGASKLTGFSKPIIYRLLAEKKLRSFKIGKRRFIDARSLREYVAEQQAAADAAPPPGRGKDGPWNGARGSMPTRN
jgi:excisionase family DNA binding protein